MFLHGKLVKLEAFHEQCYYYDYDAGSAVDRYYTRILCAREIKTVGQWIH